MGSVCSLNGSYHQPVDNRPWAPQMTGGVLVSWDSLNGWAAW